MDPQASYLPIWIIVCLHRHLLFGDASKKDKAWAMMQPYLGPYWSQYILACLQEVSDGLLLI